MAKTPNNDADSPIFSKQKINFQPSASITSVAAGNNILLLTLSNATLLRIPLQRVDEQVEIRVGPAVTGSDRGSGTRITRTFIDATGTHVLCTTSNRQTFYVHASSKTAKLLPKLADYTITSVGWNRHLSNEQSTGVILLGTQHGQLVETVINANAETIYVRQVHHFELGGSDTGRKSGSNAENPISSIELHRCAGSSDRWLILVTTPGQLHPFNGVIKASTMQAALGGQFSTTSSPSWTPSAMSSTFIAQDLGGGGETSATASIFSSSTPPRIRTLDPDAPTSAIATLHVHPAIGDDPADTFAWHTQQGVLYGKVDSAQMDAYRAMGSDVLYSFPKTSGGRSEVASFSVLSEFHLLLLYNDRMTAVGVMDQTVNYEDLFGTKFGKIVGMARDAVSGLIWTCTEQHVFKYRPDNEARHVWRAYIAKGDYEKARRYAMGDEKAVDTVLRRQAQSLIDEKKLLPAAELLALTHTSLESAALQLMRGAGDDVRSSRDALRSYLTKKLDSYDARVDRTQITLLVLWLMDVHLAELTDSRCGALNVKADAGNGGGAVDNGEGHKRLLTHVHGFMARPEVMDCLLTNREAVYRMMRDHGDHDTTLHFARAAKDWTTVVQLCMERGDTNGALTVMMKQTSPHLFYTHAPALLLASYDSEPHRVIDACMSMGSKLDVTVLLPLLHAVVNDVKMAKELLRYMDRMGDRRREEVEIVHNIGVSLFVKYRLFDELREFVRRHRRFMGHADVTARARQTHFNVHYALRLCKPLAELNECCVDLYCALHLYDEAVQLALKMDDVPLARQCVQRAMNDRSSPPTVAAVTSVDRPSESVDDDGLDDLAAMIRQAQLTNQEEADGDGLEFHNDDSVRQLWLPIARHVIERDGDMEQCMELLKASRGALHIQHLLPFFPEFATIEHFKEPLCSCLAEHSGKIDQLKSEMKEAENIATDIRADVTKMKSRYTVHEAGVCCAECNTLAALRVFYAFPCKHAFHEDCLQKLNDSRDDRQPEEGRETAELADECPFCGMYSVLHVDAPFFTAQEYMEDMKTWQF